MMTVEINVGPPIIENTDNVELSTTLMTFDELLCFGLAVEMVGKIRLC